MSSKLEKFNLNFVKALLKQYHLYPSKRLGQNFLIDREVIRKFVLEADSSSKTIIEVGPGLGNLTLELAGRAGKVVAIEKDPKLVRILNDELRTAGIKNVKVIQGDILRVSDFKFRIYNSYYVVGNLPFYLTNVVIRKFLEMSHPPGRMIFIVQKEVAERICALSPKMNLLAVSVQFYAKPEIITLVSKKSFWPQPKVDSALIKITPFSKRRTVGADDFFRLVKAGFSHPRKQILNNLSQQLAIEKKEVREWLLENKISPTQRAESLKIRDWERLTKARKLTESGSL